MPLTFAPIKLATQTYVVQKTGFPFFDACQLVGAMHAFLGGNTQTVLDKGTYWTLIGSVTTGKTQISLLGDRLLNKGLERVELTTLVFLADVDSQLEKVQAYYAQPFPKSLEGVKLASISRFLEPALLTGLKGSEGAKYSSMASQMGVSSERPLPELVVATLGLTRAALAYGNDEVLTVLPVLENSSQPLSPLIAFGQRFNHAAGGQSAAVMAALSFLVQLGGVYPVRDFAYAYHGGRGFYHGGLLGLHRLCAHMTSDSPLAAQALYFLQRSNREESGPALELARTLTHFLKNPARDTLAILTRIKARAVADEKHLPAWVRHAASGLLGTPDAIEEAQTMTELSNDIPKPSEALVKALGTVFRTAGKGSWIGSYIQLERAQKPADFYAEVAKLLSRAIARAWDDEKQKWLAPSLEKALLELQSGEVLAACEPANSKYFLAHKSTFLLRVLANLRYQKTPTSDSVPTENQPSESGEEL